ncbi:MAG TPA: hypothetical protein VFL94_12645 [Actinomycetales bacterium]|nr:hypothetical protein [Actinomycetales bacterium]
MRRLVARALLLAGALVGIGGLGIGGLGIGTLGMPVANAAQTEHPLVVVGIGGVRWSDVSEGRTPALASLSDDSAIGDVAVRSVRTATCPVDGWLTASAGRRAADVRNPAAANPGNPPCRDVSVDRPETAVPGAEGTPLPRGSARVHGWQQYVDAAAAESFDAQPGLLGEALANAGVCSTAVGPGAGVMLARRDGTVPRYVPSLQAAAATDLLARPACPLTVVDAGQLRDPADPPSGVTLPAGSLDRAQQLKSIDDRVGQVLDAVPDEADVVVVSLADDGRTPHLQLVAARGPSYPAGYLRTSSTRQTALVQLTDLTPTVLHQLGVASPTTLVGSPFTVMRARAGDAPKDPAQRLERVLDLDHAAQAVHPLTPPFFTGLVVAQIVLYGIAGIVLRTRWTTGGRRSRVLAGVRYLALVFAAVPVSTYLANTVPWWRAKHDLLTIVLVVVGYVAVISLVAQLGPWRRWSLGPFGAVAGLTALILAGDIVTGSRLQTSSLMGLQPVVAGRFYGFSNVAFALFATGAMLLAVAAADPLVQAGRRRAGAAVVAAIGVIAVVLDVSPLWGSDFGGPIGMVPGFAVLTLLVLGVRLSWRKVLLIALGTVLFLALVSVADWLRPPAQQTHLGRFVQTVIDGGAWDVIGRKADQNLSILFGSELSLMVPLGALFFALVLMRPSSWGAKALARAYDRSPTLRHGLVCLLLMLAIGFAVNDSGTVIPAIGAMLAIPLVIAASMRALQDDLRDDRRASQPTASSSAQPSHGATSER